jgi:hypothetical protein
MKGLIVLMALGTFLAFEPVLASTRCMLFAGTADGLFKGSAVRSSREALEEIIGNWRAENRAGPIVSRSASKPNPNPYWRGEVGPELFLPPDEVTHDTYTLCWKGVVSPVVCTSGARVCMHSSQAGWVPPQAPPPPN